MTEEAPAVPEVAPVAEAVAAAVANTTPPPPPAKQPVTHTPCPCGVVPTDLMINIPRGSKYGTVAGNCCAVWAMEFKVGYPATEDIATQIAISAWEAAPRA